MKRGLPLLLALLLGACVGRPVLKPLQPALDYVDIARVPFFPQDQYQCGPAALAMVLAGSGVAVTPAALVEQVYVPGRRGSFQVEMLAAARRHGRVPYVLEPRLEDVLAELGAGHPVLVFQNLGLKLFPVWHYAVLIGYDAQSETLLLHTGTEARRRVRATAFLRSWQGAGAWAAVVTPPARIPHTATLPKWLAAAAAFEQLEQPESAAAAYHAAAERWPDEGLPWFGLGNALHAQGAAADAERAYRHALRRGAGPAAGNNLAHLLLARGCPLQALATVEAALGDGASSPVQAALLKTRAAILAYEGRPAAACAR